MLFYLLLFTLATDAEVKHHVSENQNYTYLNLFINGSKECADGFFHCNNGQCIPNNLICDAIQNCDDGSDEDGNKCHLWREKFAVQTTEANEAVSTTLKNKQSSPKFRRSGGKGYTILLVSFVILITLFSSIVGFTLGKTCWNRHSGRSFDNPLFYESSAPEQVTEANYRFQQQPLESTFHQYNEEEEEDEIHQVF
ncbi:uncharacterized protein LOC142329948 [Lycorma delicatula]|uniref:uncharacterized protein LOC142329948 n=1 Tax=Lycorma delicatula TaxID=130591 RepID=UPI003F5141A9